MAARKGEAAVQHLTTAELADRLQVSVEDIYAMNSRGTGPNYLRIGKECRYRIPDVEAWEQSRLVRPS